MMNGKNNRANPGRQQNQENPVQEVLQAVDKFLNPIEDPKGELLISSAEKLGSFLARVAKMTTSQIRNLYTEAKSINYKDSDGPYRVNLLRAKFAYIAGRYSQVRDLQKIADKALAQIDSYEKFKRFIDFFEAVVAYHRAYGGKE
ncbi:type III-A CRISPR-associated protein Csm2 [Carboxydothermus hydrogenoformans]|nr:type III-A CRISPR-associated protein Csm2 [Carboxydothermus hydrogenoformans]